MLEQSTVIQTDGDACKEECDEMTTIELELNENEKIEKKDKEISDRWFKLIRINGEKLLVEHSYQGKRPNSVAIKAFNWYCRRNGKQEFECTFTIQDQTSNKNYEYTGSRALLDVPKTITRLGVVYKVNYTTTVRRN